MTNGVGVCTAGGNQNWPGIVDDGAGGGIITWMDGRSSGSSFYDHIYAQKIDRYGNLGITGVEDNSLIPKTTALMQNYPNPFNPSTKIKFSVETHSYTLLRIFDLLGREVATLVNEIKPAGLYQVEWDAKGFPSGIYFYRLQTRQISGGQASSFSETKKLILLK